MNREAYEDLYRNAWIKQNIIDREKNKKLREPVIDYQKARENGLKGGRPRPEGHEPRSLKPLSEKARMVNRMLCMGMKVREIGAVMGVSHQSITDMKHRYGLPRHEEVRADNRRNKGTTEGGGRDRVGELSGSEDRGHSSED